MAYRQHIDNIKYHIDTFRLAFIVNILIISAIHFHTSGSNPWTTVSATFDRDVEALDRILRSDSMGYEEAESLLHELVNLPEASGKGIGALQAGYWKAERAYYESQSTQEILESLNALGDVDSVATPYEWFRINYLRLKLYLYREKEYKDSYCQIISLLEHTRHMGYRAEEARILANQGLLFHLIGDPEEAMRYFGYARVAFAGLGSTADSLRNELNICNTLPQLGRTDETVRRLKNIEQMAVVQSDHGLRCNVLMSLYVFTGEDSYARLAYAQSLQTSNSMLKMKCLGNMSNIYTRDGDTVMALNARKTVQQYFSERKYPDAVEALRGIVDIYSQTGPVDSTLKYMDMLVAAMDTFSRVETLREVSKMKAQNDIRAVNSAITLAKAQTDLERRKGWIIIIVATAILLLGMMGALYMRRRAVSERKMKKLENERLAVSLRNERLQNERQRLSIELKNRELTSKALIVLKRNSILNDFLTIIEDAGEKGLLPAAQCKLLERKIKQQLNASDDWDDFTLHFEHVHPNFFKILKERYPQLTDKDMKLCAYLRLGLSTKQISQMMSVLPESVNTSRYRLRRKMGLDSDTHLESVLRDIYPHELISATIN